MIEPFSAEQLGTRFVSFEVEDGKLPRYAVDFDAFVEAIPEECSSCIVPEFARTIVTNTLLNNGFSTNSLRSRARDADRILTSALECGGNEASLSMHDRTASSDDIFSCGVNLEITNK